jgi:hypothetical protein
VAEQVAAEAAVNLRVREIVGFTVTRPLKSTSKLF